MSEMIILIGTARNKTITDLINQVQQELGYEELGTTVKYYKGIRDASEKRNSRALTLTEFM